MEIFVGDLIQRTLVPREQRSHLKSSHVEVEFTDVVGKGDGTIGHVVIPLEFPAVVFLFIEILNFGNEIFKF